MQGEEAFLTVAEFAIALAGFTSVVVVFNQRGGRWNPADRFRIQGALIASFGAGFFALLPSCLNLLGVAGILAWRISSAILAVYIASVVAWNLGSLARLDGPSREFIGRLVPVAMSVAATAVFTLQLINALGFGLTPQPGLYFVGLLHQLAVAVVAFTRTVFLRPA